MKSFRSGAVSISILTATVLPTASFSAAPCDLSAVVSQHPQSGPLPLQGQTLQYTLTPSWTFVDNGDSVRVTEKIEIALPGIQSAIVRAASSSLPNRDCDVTSSLKGQSVSPQNENLVSHFDFSGTKWACPGTNLPCGTWKQPFRTCYHRLAKTIIADGSGTLDMTMHPAFSPDGIKVETSSSQSFHLSKGVGFALFPVVGPLLAAVATKVNLLGGVSIPYPRFPFHWRGRRKLRRYNSNGGTQRYILVTIVEQSY